MIYLLVAYFSFAFTAFSICMAVVYNLYSIDRSLFAWSQFFRLCFLSLLLSLTVPLRIVINAYHIDNFPFVIALSIYFEILNEKK